MLERKYGNTSFLSLEVKMIGVDCGTSSIISARSENGKTVLRIQRDMFTDIIATEASKKILESTGIKFAIKGDKILAIGEDALTLANTFRKEVRRPMNKGVVSNKDELAKDMLLEILKIVAGSAQTKDEICFYSVPALPIDIPVEDFDTTYHSETIKDCLAALGYSPNPINEALCIVYNELGATKFTGFGMSFGAGQTNVCLANYGLVNKGAEFSMALGGDYLDKSVANRRAGLTASKVMRIKEDRKNPIHLIKDNGSSDIIRDAICKYYRILIHTILINMFNVFKDIDVDFNNPLPIVIAGGTSQALGFIDVFKEELSKIEQPFQIGDIIHAEDPLYTIAKGALIRANLG